MIHCDEKKLVISGTISEIMTDLTEIITEMVIEGMLDREGTAVKFCSPTDNQKTVDTILSGSVVTVSKYGGM